MQQITVNGNTIRIKPTKSRFVKNAYSMSEEIYSALKKIGITKQYIDLQIPRNPLKMGEPAQITWYVNDKDFYFMCNTQDRYVDNLGVIAKVISQESYAIRNGLKQFGQVMNQFKIGYDSNAPKILTAREIIGVASDCEDLEYIRFKYKQKAKDLHPDSGGDTNKFQELGNALDELEKELG